MGGNSLIYFDNGATTKPYDDVVDSFVQVATEYYGNPSSLHQFGSTAEHLLNEARNQIANLLNVNDREIIFTSGGTESNNLAIKGVAFQYKNRGKHLITTEIEHASVHNTFKQLQDHGFEISYIPVDSDGRVKISQLEEAIREDTILVSIVHVNSEIGTIQPIKEIGALLKNYPNVLFHVDNVQAAGKVPLNVRECNVDLSSYSAHKFHGLKGNGILYKKASCQLSPLITGGNQEGTYRSGTENVAGIVAMAKALRLITEKSTEKSTEMLAIKNFFVEQLQRLENITINTPSEHSAPHIINFSLAGIKSETFIHALSEKGIYVSTTSACSSKQQKPSKTLLAIGVDEQLASSAVRISSSYENTVAEAEEAIKAIKQTLQQLGKVMK